MEQKYDELYHYGVLGMKWGIRRYQNKDGSLTAEGKKRYGSKEAAEIDKHLEMISRSRKNPRDNMYFSEYGIISRSHNKKAEKLSAARQESYKAIQKIFDDNSPKLKEYRDKLEELNSKQGELYKQYRDKWIEKHISEYSGDYDEAEAFYRNVASEKDVKYKATYIKYQQQCDDLVNKSNILTRKIIDDMLGSIGNERINSNWSRWQQKKAKSKYGVWLPGSTSKANEIWNIIGPYGNTDRN